MDIENVDNVCVCVSMFLPKKGKVILNLNSISTMPAVISMFKFKVHTEFL